MKEKILALRAEGKTYIEIKNLLNCSTSTISYHCGVGQKAKRYQSNYAIRKKTIADLKELHGNKCKICGYDKCKKALHFHHLDEKTGCISQLAQSNKQKALEEVKKCVLLCSNCHIEVHEGLVNCNAVFA